MSVTGTLRYEPAEAWVGDLVIVIPRGRPNEYAAAKSYLVSRGYQDGDRVTIEGDTHMGEDPPTVDMKGVRREAALAAAPAAAPAGRALGDKPARRAKPEKPPSPAIAMPKKAPRAKPGAGRPAARVGQVKTGRKTTRG
jgi:hypothetical protein